MLKTIVSTVAVVTLTLGISSPARASLSDHTTKFTFNQPIALPGVTLPAGTYMFRLADPSLERKTIQVLNENGSHHYALVQSIPVHRVDNIGDAKIELMDTAEGMPAAVQTFFPLGESTGFEFIYPREQYSRLTGNIGEPSTIDGPGAPALEASNAAEPPALEAAQANAQPAPAAPAPSAQTSPAPEPSAGVDQNQTSRDALPQTATPLPLIAIIGALTLFGGALMLGRTNA